MMRFQIHPLRASRCAWFGKGLLRISDSVIQHVFDDVVLFGEFVNRRMKREATGRGAGNETENAQHSPDRLAGL